MTTVLLVDDDRALRKLLRAYLEQESINVLEAGSGEEGLTAIDRLTPSLVLLDVRLPGIDGFEVLRRLDATHKTVPVILVTSVDDELDQLVGYRLGAIDYVVKPVSPKVLAAKVKAFAAHVARRPVAATVVSGSVTIEPEARRVNVDGVELALTRRELELSLALAAHPGWVYTRDHLLAEVWGIDAAHIETRLVDQHIANLRRKLADAGAPDAVQTVRGVGYRLRADP